MWLQRSSYYTFVALSYWNYTNKSLFYFIFLLFLPNSLSIQVFFLFLQLWFVRPKHYNTSYNQLRTNGYHRFPISRMLYITKVTEKVLVNFFYFTSHCDNENLFYVVYKTSLRILKTILNSRSDRWTNCSFYIKLKLFCELLP